jgi:hypothetical protein
MLKYYGFVCSAGSRETNFTLTSVIFVGCEHHFNNPIVS